MERRKSERTPVSYEGALTLDGTSFPCKVRDVSGVGAMLVFDKTSNDVPTYEDMEYEAFLSVSTGPQRFNGKKSMVVRFNETHTELFLAIQFYSG